MDSTHFRVAPKKATGIPSKVVTPRKAVPNGHVKRAPPIAPKPANLVVGQRAKQQTAARVPPFNYQVGVGRELPNQCLQAQPSEAVKGSDSARVGAAKPFVA